MFYQKLKETQKESENLNIVFKQVWPLIKHKVKDPDGLLKGIVSTDLHFDTQQDTKVVETLRQEVELLRQQQQSLQAELQQERESRQLMETLLMSQQHRINEMQAFQQTVRAFTRHTSPHSPRSYRLQKGKAQTASTMDSTH